MEKEEGQQNMISNLPLLFASGYPTSLDKITEAQLEQFIPFMVQCSLGHINTQGKVKCGEPEWWPEDVPYIIPFTKPRKFTGNWMDKMKEIVIICYQFHKSIFLLKFCNDLASYEHASLRFINNYNSTTSLFDRRNNKLLVTFRNENMSYDQPQRGRKCLLKKKKSDRPNEGDMEQMMVEPAPFDIYLCDHCDAELYSQEAIHQHERTCNVEADDVILCDSPEPAARQTQSSTGANVNLPTNVATQNNDEKEEMRSLFLLNFDLQPRDSKRTATKTANNGNLAAVLSKPINDNDISDTALERRRRLTRRNRAVHSLTRCPTIPLSSPAGIRLLATSMPCTTAEYLTERLERIERFCHAPVLSKGVSKPKYLEKRYMPNCANVTFKKPADYNMHFYTFPRRQFGQRRRAEDFHLLNMALLRRCRPISVRLKKMTSPEDERKRMANKHSSTMSGGSSSALNIKLRRDTTRSWKISNPASEIIVDTIDLCSSDEELMLEKRSTSGSDVAVQLKKAAITAAKTDTVVDVGDLTVTPTPTTPTTMQRLNALRVNIMTKRASIVLENTKSINKTTDTTTTPTTPTTTAAAATTNKPKTMALQMTESNNMLPSRPLRPSLYLLTNYTNTTSNTPTSTHISNSSNKPQMLTDMLPLSQFGHNRQNTNNNNSNSNNNLTLTVNQALRSSQELKLCRDIIIKRVSGNNNINNNNNNTNNHGAPPAHWLGSAALNMSSNNNTNNNNNNINNQMLAENTNIIVEPILPTLATTVTGVTTNHHVDTCTSPNLNNLVQNRIISIDLTL